MVVRVGRASKVIESHNFKRDYINAAHGSKILGWNLSSNTNMWGLMLYSISHCDLTQPPDTHLESVPPGGAQGQDFKL